MRPKEFCFREQAENKAAALSQMYITISLQLLDV